MPSIRLTYFDSRGRAEVSRLCFAAGGVKYEDIRVDGEKWGKMKAEGKSVLGYLPILEVDDIQIGESMAIFRYAARVSELCPTDPLEIARCDMIVDVQQDLATKAIKFIFEKNPEVKKPLQEEFQTTHLPKFLGIMEKLLKSNKKGTGFMVGDKMSYADIILFNAFNNFGSQGGKLDEYPCLKGLNQRVGENAGIKAWLETRPQTQM